MTRRLIGISYDVEGLDEYTVPIPEAVVTDTRISLDWEENGYRYNAILESSDGGNYYSGHYGSPGPEKVAFIEASRFTSKSGQELLWLYWCREDTGYEGRSIVHLGQTVDELLQ